MSHKLDEHINAGELGGSVNPSAPGKTERPLKSEQKWREVKRRQVTPRLGNVASGSIWWAIVALDDDRIYLRKQNASDVTRDKVCHVVLVYLGIEDWVGALQPRSLTTGCSQKYQTVNFGVTPQAKESPQGHLNPQNRSTKRYHTKFTHPRSWVGLG